MNLQMLPGCDPIDRLWAIEESVEDRAAQRRLDEVDVAPKLTLGAAALLALLTSLGLWSVIWIAVRGWL